jgi:xylulokinase
MFHAWRRESGQANKSYPELMAEIQASPFSDSFLPCEIHHGRALVEDIGFSVRRAMDRLESAAGFVPVYALSGGQARNGIWNQMKADITGRTVFVTATPDGELMGDAVLGFAALGDYGSLEEAAGRMVRTDAVYEPDPETTKRYAEKYKAYEDIRNSGKP